MKLREFECVRSTVLRPARLVGLHCGPSSASCRLPAGPTFSVACLGNSPLWRRQGPHNVEKCEARVRLSDASNVWYHFLVSGSWVFGNTVKMEVLVMRLLVRKPWVAQLPGFQEWLQIFVPSLTSLLGAPHLIQCEPTLTFPMPAWLANLTQIQVIISKSQSHTPDPKCFSLLGPLLSALYLPVLYSRLPSSFPSPVL